jgi:hypothetical protein
MAGGGATRITLPVEKDPTYNPHSFASFDASDHPNVMSA